MTEEEKQKKIAELEKKKEEYWKKRYKRSVYEFFDDPDPDYSKMTPDVAESCEKLSEIIAKMKQQDNGIK